MKKIIFVLSSIVITAFSACNNGGSKNEHEGHDMNDMKNDSMTNATATTDSNIKVITVSFTNVDAKVALSIKEITDQYLRIKNALANDNGNEAANGGKAMAEAINKLDKSLLTAEQKKVFDFSEESLKEDAEHIGKNADKIKHQREHFATMSEDVYNLAKAFGAGRELYHVHCPMYNEDKGGAMWLNETKEVKNPFFGAAMPTCGEVEEVIK